MSEVPSKSALDVLRLYLVLSRIVGVRSIDSTNCIKLILRIIIALFICCYNIIVWFITTQNKVSLSTSEHRVEIVEYLYNSAFTLRILAVVTSVGLGLFQTKLREKSAKSLDEVDKTLKFLGSKSEFSKIYLRSKIEIVVFFFYLITIIISSTFTYLLRALHNTSYFYLLWFICLCVYAELVEYTISMDFLCFVRCINSGIQRANDLLSDVNALPFSSIAMELIKYKETNNNICKKMFTATSSRSQSRLSAIKNEIFRIRRLLRVTRQVHLELYKVSKNLSNLYGIQLSMVLAMNVFYNICFLYSLYRYRYNLMKEMFHVNEIISMIFFCLFVSFKIITINYTCDKAVQNAEKTNEIIYTFYGENTDADARQEVKMFSLQLCHCHSVYSAFGLHSFNCKYICSCIAITTTFLVVMIQIIEPPTDNKYKLKFI